jgi:hypothetical protein
MLAGSRRTASRWFRSAGVADDWDRFYNRLVSIGRNTTSLAFPLLSAIVGRFDPGEGKYWTLALDDSPTKRYGRHVEAARVVLCPRRSWWIEPIAAGTIQVDALLTQTDDVESCVKCWKKNFWRRCPQAPNRKNTRPESPSCSALRYNGDGARPRANAPREPSPFKSNAIS